MSWTVQVDNIKCGGCARSISKAMGAIEGVDAVSVNVASGRVVIEGSEAARPAVARRLRELGYPERGSESGLGAAVATAKSFVSCAVGSLAGKA